MNVDTLKQCRLQMALSVEDAARRSGVKRLAQMEAGTAAPTFKQLGDLADAYSVPQWVFQREEIPDEYRLESTPAFRRLIGGDERGFEVRRLLMRLAQYRQFLIELDEVADEPQTPFEPPAAALAKQPGGTNPAAVAAAIRRWLSMGPAESPEFEAWRGAIEDVGVFVFLTSRFKGWSHVDLSAFRGLAIYHDLLPIIVINDRDTYRAQLFTLCHELGHLLLGRSALDVEIGNGGSRTEAWCNDFAGNLLMPDERFRKSAAAVATSAAVEAVIADIQIRAAAFKVSVYAFATRMKQLGLLDAGTYASVRTALQAAQNPRRGGGGRNRPKEVYRQFGTSYLRPVVQAYYDGELRLLDLCRVTDLRHGEDALALSRLV